MKTPTHWFSVCLSLLCLSAGLHGQDEPLSLTDLVFQPGEIAPIDSDLKVKVGDIAPDFELPSTRGERVRLSDYRGKKKVVISFVPAAWTPVCSAQWPGYMFAIDYFEEANATILGITVDNIPTLHAWTTAMGGIGFPVLSDFYPHGQVAERYGILRSNGMTERALFVVDLEGVLTYIDVRDIHERPPLEELIEAIQD
jgi:peroxiredoxin